MISRTEKNPCYPLPGKQTTMLKKKRSRKTEKELPETCQLELKF